jgi:hypothetical protein
MAVRDIAQGLTDLLTFKGIRANAIRPISFRIFLQNRNPYLAPRFSQSKIFSPNYQAFESLIHTRLNFTFIIYLTPFIFPLILTSLRAYFNICKHFDLPSTKVPFALLKWHFYILPTINYKYDSLKSITLQYKYILAFIMLLKCNTLQDEIRTVSSQYIIKLSTFSSFIRDVLSSFLCTKMLCILLISCLHTIVIH